MELSTEVMVPALGMVALLGALLWNQGRANRRMRRALQRADARARSLSRH